MEKKHHGKKKKHYKYNYRQRVYLCKKCNIHCEFFGNDPVVGNCHCCNKPIKDMPLELDYFVEIDRKVTLLAGHE